MKDEIVELETARRPGLAVFEQDTIALRTAKSPFRKDKNLKCLSLSTPTAFSQESRLQNPISPTVPKSASYIRKKPRKLPMLNVALVRTPSLPNLAASHSLETPITGAFASFRDIQAGIEHENEVESKDLNVYKSGPVCILTPNLWLYSEPTVDECRQFDVVINVAREVGNPFLRAQGRLECSPEAEHGFLSNEHKFKHHAGNVSMENKTDGNADTTNLPTGSISSTKHDGVEYIHMLWDHNQAMETELPALTRLMEQRLSMTNKKVLVHCQQGISRSASLVIAYIMKVKAMDLSQAYAFVKAKSNGVGPNMSLIFQLCEWGKSLEQKPSVASRQRRSFELDDVKTLSSDCGVTDTRTIRRRASTTVRASSTRTHFDQDIPTRESLRDTNAPFIG